MVLLPTLTNYPSYDTLVGRKNYPECKKGLLGVLELSRPLGLQGVDRLPLASTYGTLERIGVLGREEHPRLYPSYLWYPVES